MAVFVTSDTHGSAAKFRKVLKKSKIDLSTDVLYHLGDILDRGSGSIKLFFDILKMSEKYPGHVHMLKGNHELFCELYMEQKLSYKQWSDWGGSNTLKELNLLTDEKRQALLENIKKMPIYEEITLNGKEYVLTHSGFLEKYAVYESDDTIINVVGSIKSGYEKAGPLKHLCSVDVHYVPNVKFDKTIIVGHQPTLKLEGYKPEVLVRKNLIDVDTGGGHISEGGKVSVLKLDTMETFYA